MMRVSSGESGLSSETKEKPKKIKSLMHLEALTTSTGPLSSRALRTVHKMAIESDMIAADLVNVEDFPSVAERYKVLAAPTGVANGSYHFYGALQEREFIEAVLKGARESSR